MRIVIIICSMLLVLSSNIKAGEQNAQSENNTVKNITTLGIKGIHLGMTRNEVGSVVKSGNGWKEKDSVIEDHDASYLSTGQPIGCSGDGETKKCYFVQKVTVYYDEDKVISIDIQGPIRAADGIDPVVKDWARFSFNLLKEKFGNHSQVNLNIDQFNILLVQSGQEVPLYIWNNNDETVKLSIGSSEAKYYPVINYSNRKALEKIEREKQK